MWVSIMVSPDGTYVPSGRTHKNSTSVRKFMEKGCNNYTLTSESTDRLVYEGNAQIPGFKIVFVNVLAEAITKALPPTERPMTFTFKSSMFTKEVMLQLVNDGCSFSFHKSTTNFGDYHIHIQHDGSPGHRDGIEMIRAMAIKQGEPSYECDDYKQPSRD